MPDNNQGFPPGYNFRRPGGGTQQVSQASNKRAKAIQDFNMGMPGGLPGVPIDFDENNAPIIEEEMAPSMPPPAPEPQQQHPQQPQARPTNNYQHPVLTRMLEKFGLKSQKDYTLELESGGAKFVYRLTMVSEEITHWALAEAQNKALLDGDNTGTSWFSLLNACAAVISIDNTPIYQIFNIKPPQEDLARLQKDAYDLSNRLRRMTSKALAQFFWVDAQPMANKLVDFYTDKVIPGIKVTSSLDRENEGAIRYVCPTDKCTEAFLKKPPVAPQTEYYCVNHGTAMIPVINAEEEANVPLA